MISRAPRLRPFALALLAAALGGCASLAPTLTPPASAPAAPTSTAQSAAAAVTTPVPATATAPGAAAPAALPADTARSVRADTATTRMNGFVPADSLPSAEAQRVLGTLPEPVPAAERAAGTADSAAIPTPAPTQPLGDKPGSLELMLTPDSTLAPPPPRAAAADTARTHAAPESGPCYRLQVGAPSDPAQAKQLSLAATSQLDLEFEIQKIKGLYKVRTRDCLSRETVDRLRERALAAGFHGVFAVAENKK